MFWPAKLNRLSTNKLSRDHSSSLFLLRLQVEAVVRKTISPRTFNRCEIIWDQVWDQVEAEVAGPIANQ